MTIADSFQQPGPITFRMKSNWREAKNLTTRVKHMAGEGSLTGNEMFLVTDNGVYEATSYKGHSDSPKLNNLVFRLHQVERVTGAIVHVIQMTVTRMKKSGINGLSHNDLMAGIMARVHPLEYLPLD